MARLQSDLKTSDHSCISPQAEAWNLVPENVAVRPGAYINIGNGAGEEVCMVHNPGYDFNDDILPLGAAYYATLVETKLAKD